MALRLARRIGGARGEPCILWVAGVTPEPSCSSAAFEGGAIWSGTLGAGRWYRGTKRPTEAIAPIFTLVAGLAVAWIA
jgi:hypothetical protein